MLILQRNIVLLCLRLFQELVRHYDIIDIILNKIVLKIFAVIRLEWLRNDLNQLIARTLILDRDKITARHLCCCLAIR